MKFRPGDIIDLEGNIKTTYGWIDSGRVSVAAGQARHALAFGWRQIGVDGELVVIERLRHQNKRGRT
jgi:hypothetical protein